MINEFEVVDYDSKVLFAGRDQFTLIKNCMDNLWHVTLYFKNESAPEYFAGLEKPYFLYTKYHMKFEEPGVPLLLRKHSDEEEMFFYILDQEEALNIFNMFVNLESRIVAWKLCQ